MLRRQDFTQKLMALFGQLQMQTATIVIALAAFNPAAFFQFISDTGGVGTRRAQRTAQLGRLNAVVFLRLQRNQRHK